MTDESDEILSRVEDGVGFVTLNRPKAINSLNQGMVNELSAVLAGWERTTAVARGGALRGRGARPVRRRGRGGDLPQRPRRRGRRAAVLARRVPA